MLSFRLTVIVLLISSSLSAQVAGRLSGSVADSSGAAIPGANVQLKTAGGTAAGSQSCSREGLFSFAGLQPGTYEIQVELKGFNTAKVTNIKVDIARETPLGAIILQPATVAQTLEVVAPANAVQTENVAIATTVTNEQISRLPQLNRNIIALITTQAGVGTNNRTGTTINGLRVSYSNVTMDGVNIQDNLLRETSLDFQPNLLFTDQVSEFTVSSSNTPTSMGFGATQVSLSTPSGTNTFHGSAFWYNRNNALAANTFFNNRDGLSLPFLNQNQAGGSLGGPIIKNKLFFYGNYEAFRLHQQTSQQRTILTDAARQGIFTYRDTSGNLQQRNILQIKGRSVDPLMKSLIDQIPGGGSINNFRSGDSTESTLRNTGGYSYLSRNNRERNNVTGKLNYYLSEKNSLFGTYLWNNDLIDLPSVTATTYTVTPQIFNEDKTNFISTGLNSTLTPNLTNELRGGFNFAQINFARNTEAEPINILGTIFSSPVQPFPLQGRDEKTFNLSDNANWVKGRHTMSFGFQLQNIRINNWDTTNTVPSYTLGIVTGVPGLGLTSADLPGASQADINAANNMLASLAGLVGQGTQRFNTASPTAGFVPGAQNRRIWTLNNYAGYFQDNWKATRRINLIAGLRYEYMTPVTETQGLALLPVLPNGNVIDGLLNPQGTLDFAKRPWYSKDRNNFAPNFGVTWDIFGDGKTVFRSGYSINFVNDNAIITGQNGPTTNPGLQSTLGSLYTGQTIFASSVPGFTTPTLKVPRSYADNYALDPNSGVATLDPNLRTPYVQQWSAGIQRALFGGVLEARYLGNRGTKQFRAIDFNQVNINVPGYMTDFKNAYNNGVLAMNAGLPFSAAYNPAVPGSQQLPFFGQLPSGGFITDPTVASLILQRQIGGLAALYQTNRLNGSVNFFPNQNALAANLLTNYSMSTYNALQLDYTRRFAKGFSFQVNYAFSKSLSDTGGDSQTNFEPFLDNNNAKIEKAPTPFDLRHAFKGNFVLDLPFGKGKKLLNTSNPVLSRIASGWSVSGNTILQSGSPFSIRSERGTLNRNTSGRSANNTANSVLGGSDLDQIVGYYMTGNGPYVVAQSAINPADGRGVGADGRAGFNGQVFYNPGTGELGALQRRIFRGPRYFNFDFSIQKLTTIRENHTLELRMESLNVFNNVAFGTLQPGTTTTFDYNINNTNFGRLTSLVNTPRRIQFGLYYRF